MEKLEKEEFVYLVEQGENIIDKEIFIDSLLDLWIENNKKVTIKGCVFKGEDIFISSPTTEESIKFSLYFIDCNFLIDELNFANCTIQNLYFHEVSLTGSVAISNLEIDSFNIRNNCKIEVLDFYDVVVFKRFSIHSNNQIKRLISQNSIFKNQFSIYQSSFEEIDFTFFKSEKSFDFRDCSVSNFISIDRCEFLKTSFHFTKFININSNNRFSLINSTFDDSSSFTSIEGREVDFYIKDCFFEKTANFNNSIFKSLEILQTNFKDISSFQETIFDYINIDRTNFDKVAYFDEIYIIFIDKCNKRTLRNIKHQLQRTNNKIDFDRFKAYEINAYRKELIVGKLFWYNDKDAFILKVADLFSKNGTDWFRALKVSLIGSFIFYSFFYWMNVNQFKVGNIDFSQISHFGNGFTKFLIPTNFYNPVLEQRSYVSGFSWIPFILGKIFLSIGIYETIVSFRKFKS